MIILRYLTLLYFNFVISLSLSSGYSSISWNSISNYIKEKTYTFYNSLPAIPNLNWFSAKDDIVDRTLNSTIITNNTSSSILELPIIKFNNLPIDQQLAKKYLTYASLSYCKREILEIWNCKLCGSSKKEDIEYISLNNQVYNTTGFILINKLDKEIILSYKGSKNTVNWLMNLKSTYTKLNLTEPFEEAKIHSGFQEMANSLYPDTKLKLEQMIKIHSDYKVIITGHSMGGALATINALQLVLDGVLTWDKLTLITYGQPRVGNKEFVNFMDSQVTSITRVNREGDPIPTVPTPPLYYHNGYNMFIKKDDSTVLCLPTDKGPNCTSPIGEMNTKSHFSYWNFKLDSDCLS